MNGTHQPTPESLLGGRPASFNSRGNTNSEALESVLTETRLLLRELDTHNDAKAQSVKGPVAAKLEALRARLAELTGLSSSSEPASVSTSLPSVVAAAQHDALDEEEPAEDLHGSQRAALRQRRAAGALGAGIFGGADRLGTDAQGPSASPVRLPPEEAAQMEDLIGQVGVLLRDTTSAEHGATQPTGSKMAAAQTTLAGVLTRTPGLAQTDVTQLAQWAMQEAYARNNTDLREYAVRTNYYTELRAQIREETSRARRFRSAMQDPQNKDNLLEPFGMLTFDTTPKVDENGNWSVRPGASRGDTRQARALDEYIKDMETLQNTIGDDQQLAQLQLQTMMQRQTQMMSALSSVSKALHETAMSILRKIGN